MQGLHRQLDREAKPYLDVARQQGHGLQVVLFVMPDGKLGSPKVSIDTRGDTRRG